MCPTVGCLAPGCLQQAARVRDAQDHCAATFECCNRLAQALQRQSTLILTNVPLARDYSDVPMESFMQKTIACRALAHGAKPLATHFKYGPAKSPQERATLYSRKHEDQSRSTTQFTVPLRGAIDLQPLAMLCIDTLVRRLRLADTLKS